MKKNMKKTGNRQHSGSKTRQQTLSNDAVRERIGTLRKLVSSPTFTEVVKSFGVETMRRGRIARHYIADSTKDVKGLNETMTNVFNTLKAAGTEGYTQQEVMDALKLPHSTVWYALVKLRKRHAVITS